MFGNERNLILMNKSRRKEVDFSCQNCFYKIRAIKKGHSEKYNIFENQNHLHSTEQEQRTSTIFNPKSILKASEKSLKRKLSQLKEVKFNSYLKIIFQNKQWLALAIKKSMEEVLKLKEEFNVTISLMSDDLILFGCETLECKYELRATKRPTLTFLIEECCEHAVYCEHNPINPCKERREMERVRARSLARSIRSVSRTRSLSEESSPALEDESLFFIKITNTDLNKSK